VDPPFKYLFGREHEVVDEELRAPSKEVCQGSVPLASLESILLVESHPREALPPRHLVATSRELLLSLENAITTAQWRGVIQVSGATTCYE
jgi:hypothetical protein